MIMEVCKFHWDTFSGKIKDYKITKNKGDLALEVLQLTIVGCGK